ncbi:MAG: radical SAM protein [Nitrospirae bacterium]|nr:radical SAM protein [Nitrospirota bacterium]
MLETRDYTYFTTVRGVCRSCREVVPARVFFRDGKVWQQSLCRCGEGEPAMIASDVGWYLSSCQGPFADSSPAGHSHPPMRGCPHDCGPCTWHASPCQLPVISITNDCEMRCPICFTYNRQDRKYYMPVDEMRRTVDWIIESSGSVDLIDITGGEPALHPDILGILACCKRQEVGRVMMNSNGLRLSRDMDLCRRIADLGVYVNLSFNTFDPAASKVMHGADVVDTKLRAIDNLTRAGARITLLNVMMRGVNEDATSGILGLMLENDSILSLIVQTMTYTGQGGGTVEGRAHIPVDEAAKLVAAGSGGMLEFTDFLPRPSAHPLCYLTCYMMKSGRKFHPFARFAPAETLMSFMADSYLMRLDDRADFFREIINELYAKGDEVHMKAFRELIKRLYPDEGRISPFMRQRLAESSVRTVYVHAHMDEDSFDCARAMLCPDLVPSEPGRLIPACTYNLFHRMKDERFHA